MPSRFIPALFLVLILVLTGPALLSVPPAAYYEQAEGKLGEELREALADITGGHTRVSYSWPPFVPATARREARHVRKPLFHPTRFPGVKIR